MTCNDDIWINSLLIEKRNIINHYENFPRPGGKKSHLFTIKICMQVKIYKKRNIMFYEINMI